MYVDPGKNLEFGVAVNVRKDALPLAAAKCTGELGKPSALWKAIPEDALFALAARTDFFALTEFVASFCDTTKQKEIRGSVEGSLRPFLPEGARLEELLQAAWLPDYQVSGSKTRQAKDDTVSGVPAVHDGHEDSKIRPKAKWRRRPCPNAVQFLTMIA